MLLDTLQLTAQALKQPIKHLSHGNRQKLGIVLALEHEPDLAILDEPTLGLDPLMQEAFYDILRMLHDKGETIFLSSHVLSEVEKVCDRVAIIRGGRLVALEALEALKQKRPRRIFVFCDSSRCSTTTRCIAGRVGFNFATIPQVIVSETVHKRRIGLVLGALVVPFVLLRVWLFFTPNADFNVAGYNIHHLFTGLLLITVGGLPLALFRGASRWLDVSAVVFGVGLSLALDEWVYLIATDGSNASYLLPVSFWGGLVMIVLACVYVGVLLAVHRRRGADKK